MSTPDFKTLPFKIRKSGDVWTATCPRKLWSVSGGDREFVTAEAWRYYAQYLAGGEYATPTALNGDTP